MSASAARTGGSTSDTTRPQDRLPAPAASSGRSGPLTLGRAFVEFYDYLSPRLLTATVIIAWAVRLYLGDWRSDDLVIIAVILAIWPFQEWIFHVFSLHFRPFDLFGRRVDFLVSKKHRLHHQDPTSIPILFIPLHIVIPAIPLFSLASILLASRLTLAFTTIGFYYLMSLLYEWTHYLIHTSYRPRSKLYRRLWQNHRLHHYKNERYWFGILMPFVDGIFRTAPDYRKVELSPTCRTLGIESRTDASSSVPVQDVNPEARS